VAVFLFLRPIREVVMQTNPAAAVLHARIRWVRM
jgi:hypothetical protein